MVEVSAYTFIFVFIIILIGFLLVFGFQQIQNLFGLSGEAQIRKSLADLENVIEETALLSRGSSRTYTVRYPATGKICFVNVTHPGTQLYTQAEPWRWWCPGSADCRQPEIQSRSPAVETMVKDNRYNTWLYFDPGDIGEGQRIPGLKVSQSFCTRPGTELYLENQGLVVSIDVA